MNHFFLCAYIIIAPSFLSYSQSYKTASDTVICFNAPIIQDAAIGYHDGFSTANNSYPSATQLAAYCIPASGNPGVNINRGLLEFDLSSIPVGVSIVSASLDLYAHGPAGTLSGHSGSANEAFIQRVTAPWVDNTVSWNTQPASTATNQASLAASTDPLEDYFGIDVTGIVTDMYSTNNYGFLIRQQVEQVSNVLLFASSDFSDPSKHPTLEVCYQQLLPNITCVYPQITQDAAIGYHDGFSTANNSYPSATQLAAYCIPASGNPGVNINRGLLEFDLSSIPVGVSIVSASLDLYAHGPAGTLSGHSGSANEAFIQRVTAPWVDNSVSWNTQPASTATNQASLAASTDPMEDYLGIDVTGIVTDMYSTNNYGFLIRQQVEQVSNVLLFASSDFSDPSKHPTLEVCYKPLTGGIVDILQNSFIDVYPNPFNNNLQISFNEDKNPEILIYNSLGKLVFKHEYQLTNAVLLDLDFLSSGLYLLNINIDSHAYSSKIIKN